MSEAALKELAELKAIDLVDREAQAVAKVRIFVMPDRPPLAHQVLYV